MTTSVPRPMGAEQAIAEIDVVASDRVEDVDDALAVVHDGFVEAGYLAPQASGRRMHPSYLNPGTIFFVARIEGEAVGTCALIADGPFGLPSDRAFAEENDALRAECDDPLWEAGSLVIRSEHRRSTRRIVMRLFAAMTRVALHEFPHSPVPMAVAPENERFYGSLAGARELAGERPLYGAPAVLLLTGGAALAAHCARKTTPSQRRMHALITEPSPSWLTDRRTHRAPPRAWLEALVEEQGVTQALAAQIELLSERHPHVLATILRRARTPMVA
ncbi:MAG: hypothetical protein JHC74_11350 [Thermoleophilia bacterium]|nr:hypothetical protein [Thermoleophilia bacterium]